MKGRFGHVLARIYPGIVKFIRELVFYIQTYDSLFCETDFVCDNSLLCVIDCNSIKNTVQNMERFMKISAAVMRMT